MAALQALLATLPETVSQVRTGVCRAGMKTERLTGAPDRQRVRRTGGRWIASGRASA
jgi:hypothetical protein